MHTVHNVQRLWWWISKMFQPTVVVTSTAAQQRRRQQQQQGVHVMDLTNIQLFTQAHERRETYSCHFTINNVFTAFHSKGRSDVRHTKKSKGNAIQYTCDHWLQLLVFYVHCQDVTIHGVSQRERKGESGERVNIIMHSIYARATAIKDSKLTQRIAIVAFGIELPRRHSKWDNDGEWGCPRHVYVCLCMHLWKMSISISRSERKQMPRRAFFIVFRNRTVAVSYSAFYVHLPWMFLLFFFLLVLFSSLNVMPLNLSFQKNRTSEKNEIVHKTKRNKWYETKITTTTEKKTNKINEKKTTNQQHSKKGCTKLVISLL